MKTALIGGKRRKLEFAGNSGMFTRGEYRGHVYLQMGADYYRVEGLPGRVIVLTSGMADIKSSVTYVTNERWDELTDLRDPYHEGRFHTALIKECGGENYLQLY